MRLATLPLLFTALLVPVVTAAQTQSRSGQVQADDIIDRRG
jgi:hypothetical protein